MKIAIDMQGAQTDFSRHRGVGRYTFGIVEALLRKNTQHDILLFFNGYFTDSILYMRKHFEKLIPSENLKVWYHFYETSAFADNDNIMKRIGELHREAFISSFDPDIIFSTNLQEGFFEPATTSVKQFENHACYCSTLHDVIPLTQPDKYLNNQNTNKWYMEKLDYIKQSDLILTVSEYSRQLISELTGIDVDKIFVVHNAVDHSKFFQVNVSSAAKQNLYNKYGISKQFLMYTGGADIHKNLYSLYKAISMLPSDILNDLQLVLVSKELKNQMDAEMQIFNKLNIQDKVIFTGFVSDEELRELFSVCLAFVFPSIQEGFGLPPLEAMACGAPVICSNTSSLPEVVGNERAYFDPHDVQSISNKIIDIYSDSQLRDDLKAHSLKRAAQFTWEESAEKLLEIFDKNAHVNTQKHDFNMDRLLQKIADKVAVDKVSDNDMLKIAHSIAETFQSNQRTRLYLDVSAMILSNDHTGIQRVVYNICYELSKKDLNYDVTLVYSEPNKNRFYAVSDFFDKEKRVINYEDPVIFYGGDILLFLDLHPSLAISSVEYIKWLRAKGVKVTHVVYDLLPHTAPNCFWKELCTEFENWLDAITQSDGAICISKDVADKLQEYCILKQRTEFKIDWFHLGANIIQNKAADISKISDAVKETFNNSDFIFLMVGSIEPRKGHAQTLNAFNELWNKGYNYKLVIVGKQRWGTEKLAKEIQNHPELNKNLFWFNNTDDETLTFMYQHSSCLIAASEGEGFGLPLIEAAQYNIPLIIRNIPVFVEVAGNNAYFFNDSLAPSVISEAVIEWASLYERKLIPKSGNIKWMTWSESADMLYERLIKL